MTGTLWTPTRRGLVLGAGALAAIRPSVGARAGDEERHGLSSFGELKYGPAFAHFDYVNPLAPKGGRFAGVLLEMRETTALFDFNHPLAGQALQFEVKLISVL